MDYFCILVNGFGLKGYEKLTDSIKFNSNRLYWMKNNYLYILYGKVMVSLYSGDEKKTIQKKSTSNLLATFILGFAVHIRHYKRNPPSPRSAPFSPTFFRLSHDKKIINETFPWDNVRTNDISGPSTWGQFSTRINGDRIDKKTSH